MNKGKSFLCVPVSETVRLLKYVLYVLAFQPFFATATALLATIPLTTQLLLSLLLNTGTSCKILYIF